MKTFLNVRFHSTVNWINPKFFFQEIPPIEKELMCGDTGSGAMATVQMIASIVASEVKNRFAVYSDNSSL